MLIPEHENRPDSEFTPESASTIRKVADALGVIAGVLFLVAFGIHLVRQGEVSLWLLGLGVLFLLFPLLVNRFVRPRR